jgi:putative ABC transport system permease protein
LIETVASLALLAAIFIIANAVALALLERRREIGILKAMGHTSRSVLGATLMENGVVGLTAGLLAMAVAVPGSLLLARQTLGLALAPSAAIVLGIALASALVCTLVAAAVAWTAVRVRPLEVLRYE